MGDFNEILHPHEKVGETTGNSSIMQNFTDFVDNFQLFDLESIGLPYTWFNKRRNSTSNFENLDRVFINDH